jgi:CRISPR/Cas system-associated exonuclease Cas4 (RecB family)
LPRLDLSGAGFILYKNPPFQEEKMNINCSAGMGVLDTQKCLTCALDHPGCGFDYAVLKAMFGSSEQEQRRNEIHVTDLTGCIRKAWYDKTNTTAEYPHEMLTRWIGTKIHSAVEGSDELMDSELPVAYDGLVGKSDIVYKDGRIVDIKSTRWLMPAKVPYGSHVLQVNIYAYLLRKMGRQVTSLQIQYIDASGPSKCRKCRLPVRMYQGELRCPSCGQVVRGAHLGALLVDVDLLSDEEILERIQERKENLENALAMGIAPEKEPGYLCSYCAHLEKCGPSLMEGD